MARDAETIQADIERARDGLAMAVDEITTRADPRRAVEQAKSKAQEIWEKPVVKYSVMGVGGLVVLLMIKKLFR